MGRHGSGAGSSFCKAGRKLKGKVSPSIVVFAWTPTTMRSPSRGHNTPTRSGRGTSADQPRPKDQGPADRSPLPHGLMVAKLGQRQSRQQVARDLACAPATVIRTWWRYRDWGEEGLLDQRSGNGRVKVDFPLPGRVVTGAAQGPHRLRLAAADLDEGVSLPGHPATPCTAPSLWTGAAHRRRCAWTMSPGRAARPSWAWPALGVEPFRYHVLVIWVLGCKIMLNAVDPEYCRRATAGRRPETGKIPSPRNRLSRERVPRTAFGIRGEP